MIRKELRLLRPKFLKPKSDEKETGNDDKNKKGSGETTSIGKKEELLDAQKIPVMNNGSKEVIPHEETENDDDNDWESRDLSQMSRMSELNNRMNQKETEINSFIVLGRKEKKFQKKTECLDYSDGG